MLINCVAYEQGTKLADIAVAAIGDYLARPGCFVWVALKDASADELVEMQRQFHLHDLAIEDARHGHQRPKIEEYGDTVFTVMHMIEYTPANGVQVGEVCVFVGPNFVFYALMDAVVDRYFPVIDALEEELETVEVEIFKPGAARQNIERLYALKRRVGVLRHAVVPLMEATNKLFGGRVPPVCERSQDYFRDVHDHLVRNNATLESLRETTATAIQVNLSMVTIEESETTKRLAAWAGIFAVATAFVGVWGMNFENLPELKWRWGYPLAVAVIAAVCGLMYRRFRKAGWL